MFPRDVHNDPDRRDARLRAIFLAIYIVGLIAIGAAWMVAGRSLS